MPCLVFSYYGSPGGSIPSGSATPMHIYGSGDPMTTKWAILEGV